MQNIKDVIVVGFALFAMFFGAGNLIFPPFLGLVSGSSWLTGFGGFVLADVGLALLAMLAAAKCNGEISKVLSRSGKVLSVILGCAIMICLGPLLAIPRTAATTFEMGIMPIFNGFNPVVFSIIFFVITLLLTIKPSKVVDIIGSFLTPALLIALAVLIVAGILHPLGDISNTTMIDNVFVEGINQGYQTMDALGAVALSAVIITTIANKGYKDDKLKVKLTLQAGIVASIGLCLVYGGLTYLGDTVSTKFGIDVVQTSLIVDITSMLLGQPGKIILALIVGLACLTTSVGLTSATGQYFTNLTNGKLKYEIVVVAVCIFSAIVSNFGVSTIVKFSAPILSIIYPATVTLIVLTLFGNKIKNDNVFKFATYTALIVSLLTVANDFNISIPFVLNLPFASYGFNWIVPVIIGGVIGNFIKAKNDTKIKLAA